VNIPIEGEMVCMVTKKNASLLFLLGSFCVLLAGCPPPLPPPPEITTSSPLPNAKVGKPYSVSLRARGGERPLIWSGTPPAGLTLEPDSGQITGLPDRAGDFHFQVTVKDSSTPARSTSKIFALSISRNVPLAISTPSRLPSAGINQPYSKILETVGAEGELNWSSINLTDDFTLNQRTGAIEGTPERTGTFTFDAKVTDSTNQCATKHLVLGVLAIMTDNTLPEATEGQHYTQSLQAADGNLPLKWSGTLPENLSLNPETGEIQGTPARAGNFKFAVRVTDSSTPPRSVSKTFQLTVNPKQP
jgi:Putative Ig domain